MCFHGHCTVGIQTYDFQINYYLLKLVLSWPYNWVSDTYYSPWSVNSRWINSAREQPKGFFVFRPKLKLRALFWWAPSFSRYRYNGQIKISQKYLINTVSCKSEVTGKQEGKFSRWPAASSKRGRGLVSKGTVLKLSCHKASIPLHPNFMDIYIPIISIICVIDVTSK